jgi:hypothetical protein
VMLKRVKNFEKLFNWYAQTIKDIDGVAAKVICQRSNFSYDSFIRRSFIYWLVGLSATLIIITISVALVMNVGSRALVAMSVLDKKPR